MEESENESSGTKLKMKRCLDWLQKQNESKKSIQSKNDIQFIIKTNSDRKKFLISAAEDEATVPAGVTEPAIEPKAVALRHLRSRNLNLECEWQSCGHCCSDYEAFQKHVLNHHKDLQAIKEEECIKYFCLWDICGYSSSSFDEMIRHINYHAYHAKLLAIGFNGRATLELKPCKKDSSKRNILPKFLSDHQCMWTGCKLKFNSIQKYFDHVKHHVIYLDKFVCSWGGCGAKFQRRTFLTLHVRSHTEERVIACYHCGQHYSCNRKLRDHLRKQNVYANSPYSCGMCGTRCATEYLLNEHARRHVSAYVCSLCDMSAPSPGALANHMRYKHLDPQETRVHHCPHCDYRAIMNSDLQKHITRRHLKPKESDDESLDGEGKPKVKKKKMSTKKFACHMCPDKKIKIFSRGSRLTTHLVNDHGVQWPCGHSRFRYQISEDGMYRLITTRYEVLEVSKKIVDGYSGPKGSLTTKYDVKIEQTAEATETTPKQFLISLVDDNAKPKEDEGSVEITMCDVDEDGNVIRTEVIDSDFVYGQS